MILVTLIYFFVNCYAITKKKTAKLAAFFEFDLFCNLFPNLLKDFCFKARNLNL